MPTSDFNHGTRVLRLGDDARPIEVADQSNIGAVVTAPDADLSIPRDEPFHFFTHDTETVAKLGATGTVRDVINLVKAQGIEASIVLSVVEEGADIDATRTKLMGSAASMTGVHALSYALGHVGKEPDILICPGFVAGRVDNAKNPVADALEQVGDKLMAISVFDTGGPTKEDSLEYRADFASRFTYLVDPYVRVLPEGGTEIVAKPASPVVAGLMVKKDKEKGGVYWSPSNQEAHGVLGIARPVSFFDGEIDHEANYLNENGIATFIPAKVVQQAGGAYSANGRILWGNRTASLDPLWVFINVVRTRASIEKSMVRSFRPWANDQNISPQHVISVMRSTQNFLDELKAPSVGAILGGEVFWDREVNTNSSLRLGKLRVDFDAEEAPPLEDLIFGSRRNEAYFNDLATAINERIAVSFERTVDDYLSLAA
ncbi:hypothetical protein GGD81_001389 [Rhodobium orientis]|uniref:Phage tail protein n=1 Tax=Rhodobium orientis TaxID=34017 RepID=A0A327JJZ8_9HYPH|nr:phage tail sheath subtilisin-like domain-containing protein [Rhodobium orientis]MBB4302362.1 hypothetical protein [Rhodobium orientis]MBK5949066.1 phage tail protein [Rhodobium orientis]RAI26607.1 phage tail protein [Rhodobium orientis]